MEAGCVSVGCPPSRGEGWISFRFDFHSFADLPAESGDCTESPTFLFNENWWTVDFYPGGDGDDEETEGFVSIFMCHDCGDREVLDNKNITFEITILNKNGARAVTKTKLNHVLLAAGRGWSKFTKRSRILDKANNFLDENGTLAVVISIKETPKPLIPFVPRNPCQNLIKETFLDEETSDVCFEVANCNEAMEENGVKRAKCSTSFHAHRFILRTCAPMLACLCEVDCGKMTIVSITDVKPEVFRHMLWYVYGGSIPEQDLKTHAKDIIDAADKYSIVSLKLEAEVAYVNATQITMENAMENLLYADSKNCALLKETVMDYLVENDIEAANTNKISFDDFPGHVVKDLLVATARSKREYNMGIDNKDNNKDDASDLNTMRVSELRKWLQEKGLDVDGSREAMIETLRKNVHESVDESSSEEEEFDG